MQNSLVFRAGQQCCDRLRYKVRDAVRCLCFIDLDEYLNWESESRNLLVLLTSEWRMGRLQVLQPLDSQYSKIEYSPYGPVFSYFAFRTTFPLEIRLKDYLFTFRSRAKTGQFEDFQSGKMLTDLGRSYLFMKQSSYISHTSRLFGGK